MNINRLYKYSILLLLFFSSGLLFLVVGQIDNHKFRYIIFDIFQFGTDNLFKLVDWKFHTSKDNTIWVSYDHIAPTVNLIASVLWTGLFLFLRSVITKLTNRNNVIPTAGFWKRVFMTNLTLSLFFFLFWLFFMDLDFMYDGVYSKSPSILNQLYSWFSFLMFLPSFIPGIIGSLTLDSGGDSAHGYNDMYLGTKIMTSFALTFWSITGVYLYDKIKVWRTSKLTKTK